MGSGTRCHQCLTLFWENFIVGISSWEFQLKTNLAQWSPGCRSHRLDCGEDQAGWKIGSRRESRVQVGELRSKTSLLFPGPRYTSIPKPTLSPNGAWWRPQKKMELIIQTGQAQKKRELEQIMIIQTTQAQKRNKLTQFLMETNIFDMCKKLPSYKSVFEERKRCNLNEFSF